MSKERYELPWYIRQYVKAELMEYQANKKRWKDIKDSRLVLLIQKRLESIEKVLESLSEEERREAELIFFKRYSKEKAELEGISKHAYYNLMNKVIYMTAQELEIIWKGKIWEL